MPRGTPNTKVRVRHENQHKPPSPLLSGPQPCSPSFGQSVPLGAGGGAQDPKPPHCGDTEPGRPPYNCTPSQLAGPFRSSLAPKTDRPAPPLGRLLLQGSFGGCRHSPLQTEVSPLDPPPPLMPLPVSPIHYSRPDPTQTPFFHLAGPCLPLAYSLSAVGRHASQVDASACSKLLCGPREQLSAGTPWPFQCAGYQPARAGTAEAIRPIADKGRGTVCLDGGMLLKVSAALHYQQVDLDPGG